MNDLWNQAQEAERLWHGSCVNSYHEETKQLHYAERIGLAFIGGEPAYPLIDMQDRTVIDIGGGPYSLLLKCCRVRGMVVDPCDYPAWTRDRYAAARIGVVRQAAETFVTDAPADEVWLYNVLQHTADPRAVVRRCLAAGRLVRVYEWIDTATNEAHPNTFSRALLESWLGGPGFTERYCNTAAFYGVFPGRVL